MTAPIHFLQFVAQGEPIELRAVDSLAVVYAPQNGAWEPLRPSPRTVEEWKGRMRELA
jgi:hypothetical protein